MALQWLSLIAVIWLQSINGTNSNFPAYSSELKRILSISQLQLNNLASANDAGKLLGWISGLAVAHLPLWLLLIIGSMLGLIGYGLQFLFLTNTISSLSYWQVLSLNVLAGNGICWINTVCYIVAIKNFPIDQQIAVGLMTSYIGLSGKIYTGIVDAIAPSTSTGRAKLFLLLNSVLPLLVCIVASPLARDVHIAKSRKLAGGFITMFVITIITGIFSIISSLGSSISRILPPLIVLIGMVVLLLLPLVIPFCEKIIEKLEKKCRIRVWDEDLSTTFASMEINGEKNQESRRDFLDIGVIEEIGPKMMLRKVEFWLYFFVYLFGATLGLVYLNNLGQIAESRGCTSISSLVSMSAAFSFFGRLIPSILEYLMPKNIFMASKAGAMAAIMTPMCVSFLMLSSLHQNISLYISTAILSLCSGAITSIAVSTTTQLFGTKNFGVNHNIVVSNIPIGSFVFGDLAALFYKLRNRSREENCMGHKCYQTTFIGWGCLCILGTFFAFILHKRIKRSVFS